MTSTTKIVSRLPWPALEFAVSLTIAVLFAEWSSHVDVDPLQRTGQISGLAILQFRFAVVGLVLIGVLAGAAYMRNGGLYRQSGRLVAAALAGLATGLVAGGIEIALLNTCNPLYYPISGDSARIVSWINSIMESGSSGTNYPPLFLHIAALWAKISGNTAAHVYRDFQVMFLAMTGPLTYLAWRLLLPPFWAIGFGVIPILPLLDPYKPFSNLTLYILVPLFAKFISVLSASSAENWRISLVTGVLFGAGFGLLFAGYPGWFWWCAAGVVAAVLWRWPKRSMWKALPLLASTGVIFAAIAIPVAIPLLENGSVEDTYKSFDVYVQPAFIAMWRTDFPGAPGEWPPAGELGGVGVFTLILAIGLGAGIALGLRHIRTQAVVVTVSCFLASAWLMRFWFASSLFATNSPQLYPRTSYVILHCFLILLAAACYVIADRHRLQNSASADGSDYLPTIGVLAALLFLFASAGGAIADRYMPRNDNSVGYFAWATHQANASDLNCRASDS